MASTHGEYVSPQDASELSEKNRTSAAKKISGIPLFSVLIACPTQPHSVDPCNRTELVRLHPSHVLFLKLKARFVLTKQQEDLFHTAFQRFIFLTLLAISIFCALCFYTVLCPSGFDLQFFVCLFVFYDKKEIEGEKFLFYTLVENSLGLGLNKCFYR